MNRRLMSRRRLQRGLTLVELMVVVVIVMVMSGALFGILAVIEERGRTGAALNDAEQAGQLATHYLDQWARSAGSGIAAVSTASYGCAIQTPSIPDSSLPAPFKSIDRDLVLAPALIVPGGTTPSASGNPSDALVLMSGMSGSGGAAVQVTAVPTATKLTVPNVLTLAANDLVLLVDPTAGTPSNCAVTQISAATGTSVTLGGTLALAELPTLTADTLVMNLGHPQTTPPQFLLVGVGEHDVLYTADLLLAKGEPTAQARVQGVFEMHAIYGVNTDTKDDGSIDAWVAPDSGKYAYSALSAGGATAAQHIPRIKALRVALILRVPLKEKEALAPAELTWFNDLAGAGLQGKRSLSADERRFRYRVTEMTIPVRNSLDVNS